MKINLNPNVVITPPDKTDESGLYHYAHTGRNTYVMVNEENHQLIQRLTQKTTLADEMKVWQGLVDFLYDRYIIDIVEQSNPLWQKLSVKLDSREKRLVCWDLRGKSTIDEKWLCDFFRQQVLAGPTGLKLITDQLDTLVQLIASKANCVMQEIILQTSELNAEAILPLAEWLDRVIFQISPEKLLEEIGVLKQLLEKLKWKIPAHPTIALEHFIPEIIPILQNLDMNVNVEFWPEDHGTGLIDDNLRKNLSDILQANPHFSVVYYQREELKTKEVNSHQSKIYVEKKVIYHGIYQRKAIS